MRDLWQAYEACRRRKRGTRDAQRYDQQLLDHLVDTRQALAARQWRWFVRQWPEALVLVQTGHAFELYDHQARVLAQWLSIALDSVPRRPFAATLSWPLKRLRGVRRYLRRQGVPYVFVAEEGHLPGGLKRRVLRLAWWPHQSRLLL